MMLYLDTSALVKLYVDELKSETVSETIRCRCDITPSLHGSPGRVRSIPPGEKVRPSSLPSDN
jgi:hypothetical protein